MTTFPVSQHRIRPERSKSALRQLQSAFGMIPNIAGAMATEPNVTTVTVFLLFEMMP
jgi:hypothetical protein